MRAFLLVMAILSGGLSLLAIASAAMKGTDIQLIAGGVFGTMFAVCAGLSSVIGKLEDLKGK